MKKIDTIREVLEFYAQGDWNGDPAKKALAALSTIDPDAIRRDCEKRTAVIATERNLLWMLAYDLRYKKPDNDREFSDYEADVLLEKICPAGFDNEYEQLRAAILGTEPAREES